MCAFQLFLSVDPFLGRLDYSLLSDQALMEMLIEGFDDETKKKYQDDHGMYLDVCEWPKIKCDEDESVIDIDINSINMSGTIGLCYVPPKVKLLEINWGSGSKLTGSVDLACLPDGMEALFLNCHQLTGEIDLTHLPDKMRFLFLRNNQFTGEIDLTKLPDGLRYLYIENNQLTGEIDLTQLPEGMHELSLFNNSFTGQINLAHIPNGLRDILLRNNQLTGSLSITNVPPNMCFIDMQYNNFNSVAVVHSRTHANIKLQESGVASVVDENGKELDSKRFFS